MRILRAASLAIGSLLAVAATPHLAHAWSVTLGCAQTDPPFDQAYLYYHAGYTGTCYTVTRAWNEIANIPSFSGNNLPNDQISSVKVGSGSLTLYQHINYGGNNCTLTWNNGSQYDSNLGQAGGCSNMNDQASSLVFSY